MRESRFTTPEEFFSNLSDELLKQVRVSLPAHVLVFNNETQLAEVQIGLNRRKRDGTNVTPTPLIEVPVHFPGGGFMVEYEITPGTEGVLLFSHRDISSWLNSGATQDLSSLRKFDPSDSFFVPGLRSQANAIQGFENDGITLRNLDRTRFIWLKNDGSIEINATSITANCDIDIGSNTITAGEATINGIDHSGHTHQYTDDGSPATTQGPQ